MICTLIGRVNSESPLLGRESIVHRITGGTICVLGRFERSQPMRPIPKLNDQQIRRRCGDKSFERGQDYATDGAVFDARRQGISLKASCQGSRGAAYRLCVNFDEHSKITDADCTCPVGDGGCCKHVAALLLCYQRDPDAFVETEEIDVALSRRSREELIALVRQMLLEEPELEWLLTMPLPAGDSGATDAETYRRRAAAVFDRAGDEWGVEAQIARKLKALCAIGDGFLESGDCNPAAAVYRGVAEAVMERQADYEDESGDLLGIIDQCAAALVRCLEGIKEPSQRQPVLRAMFEISEFDLDRGGIDVGGDATAALIEKTTPAERKLIAQWIGEATKGADKWKKECLERFRGELHPSSAKSASRQ